MTALKIYPPFSRPLRLTKLILVIALAIAFCFPIAGISQTGADEPSDGIDKSRRHLLLITKRRLVLQRQIDDLFKKSASKITSENIDQLQAQLGRLDLDFESRVTQLALEDPALKKKKKLDWIQEIQELTKPLLTAIRDITEKPRMIEEFKTKIEALESKLQRHQEASINIAVLFNDLEKTPLPNTLEGQKFQARITHLQDKYDPELVLLNLIEARANLEKVLSTDESVVESATKTIKEFFQTRGRNLLVTILTFAGFWWILSRLRRWILARKFLTNRTSSIGKLFSAAYNFVVLIFCLLVGLACLYFFNDWLLITLIIMGLFLLVWTSRQWIPKFLQEIKLIVDLGTVREGERMIWQGVPWLVEEIRLQAILVNERLEGGVLRLPLHDLVGEHSRPVVKNEPWFPTRTRDWVILSDNSYGRVENQTMEQVVLKLKGGALKYYATADFLAQNPINISNGFRYSIQFGLDYAVQSRICDDIPRLFEEGIKKHLKHHFEGDPPDFSYLEVSFDSVGESSLNLMVIVHVDGRCADWHEENQREIQATLVRLCNENGWVIPFNQLTVNMPDGNSVKEKNPHQPQAQPREGRV